MILVDTSVWLLSNCRLWTLDRQLDRVASGARDNLYRHG
jgi:hypothetical protein